MDYFSARYLKVGGDRNESFEWQLFSAPTPLMYGLFAARGESLMYLGDAYELRSAVMCTTSLVMAAVDWDASVEKLLTSLSSTPDSRPEGYQSPVEILSLIAYDPRFGGISRLTLRALLNDPDRKNNLLSYIGLLDAGDPSVLARLAILSVQLLCATHKPGNPAFDYYLAFLPTLVNSARILHGFFRDNKQGLLLVRGLWFLMIAAYADQLRPVIDPNLMESALVPEQGASWELIFADLRSQDKPDDWDERDWQLLRVWRSLQALAEAYPNDEAFYLVAAWKLKCEWKRWTGFGNAREDSLNIRI
jgi:hypothetical protein